MLLFVEGTSDAGTIIGVFQNRRGRGVKVWHTGSRTEGHGLIRGLQEQTKWRWGGQGKVEWHVERACIAGRNLRRRRGLDGSFRSCDRER